MQKSYTAPFYDGIQQNGMIIINTPADLLNDEDRETLAALNVKVFNHDATKLALEIGKTELSTNMAMIGACAGVTKVVGLESLDGALQERFGKKFVASGGTASLDEAIKKKYKKKNDLIKANMECIKESYSLSQEWAAKQENLQLVEV